MTFRKIFPLLGLLFVLGAVSAQSAHAATSALPAGFTRAIVAQGLTNPTAFAFSPDGILVTEKDGAIQVIQNDGSLRAQPYATLNVSTEIERGLVGIALHPKYATQPYVYVYYTTAPGALAYSGTPENRVSRFRTVNGFGTNEEIILDHIPSPSGMHNGGDLLFGYDGKLLVTVGDGNENGGMPAQVRRNLLGKVLRLNPDGTIPNDNPYAHNKTARHEIFAYGFRNPFRIALRAKTLSYFVADVGWGEWEELDVLKARGNYGWPMFEGPCPKNTHCDPTKTDFGATIPPTYYYDSSLSSPTSIIGGAFAEGSPYPKPYKGAYFFGDMEGWVKIIKFDKQNRVRNVLAFDTITFPVQFRLGPDKNIYVLDFGDGILYRYVYTPTP